MKRMNFFLRIIIGVLISVLFSAFSPMKELKKIENRVAIDFNYIRKDSCQLNIPDDANWIGRTSNNTGGMYGYSDEIRLEKTGDFSYRISDFSAGLLDQFGQGTSHEALITFNCDGIVQTHKFTSEWGEVHISGGTWKETNNEITFYWEIPFNSITETSVITLNN